MKVSVRTLVVTWTKRIRDQGKDHDEAVEVEHFVTDLDASQVDPVDL